MDKKKEKFWLFAFRDHLANARTFNGGIDVVNVDGSGDYKLLIADRRKSLRTFSGTSQLREVKLPLVPSAITSFFMPKISRRFPVVAVAVGSTILMFANEKPLYQYRIPSIPVDDDEANIWELLVAQTMSTVEAIPLLQRRLEQGVQATSRTLDFLLLESEPEREAFVSRVSSAPLAQLDTVTVLSSITHTPDGTEGGMSSLVIGTEHQIVYVLDTNCRDLLLRVELPSPPVFFIVAGCFVTDYRIVVACRHGQIYSIKNGCLASHVIQPDSPVCAMVRYDHQIVVATTSNTVTHFSLKGKRHLTLFFRQPVNNLATITDPVTGEARGLVVGLSDGTLQVYVGRTLCHSSTIFSATVALAFGRYGREESALIAVLQNGAVLVQLLHRNALLDVQRGDEVVPAAEQDIPIPVPRLSSIFKTQTERESLYGADVYRSFQYDLCHLRLQTARKYLEVFSPAYRNQETSAGGLLSSNLAAGTLSLHQNRQLRLSSTIQGLGPVFKIRVELESLAPQPLENLVLMFTYDPLLYHMPSSLCVVSYLAPGQPYKAGFLVRLVDGEVGGEPIGVSVLSEKVQEPLTSLTIELPEKEFIETF